MNAPGNIKFKVIAYAFCSIILFSCKKDQSASLPSVTTTEASQITSNAANTGGEMVSEGGSAISKLGVCYATHPTPTVGDSVMIDAGGSENFTTTLNNLYSYTKYYARAFAINESGTAYGNEIVFTTLPGLPSITTTAVTHVIPLSAISGGNILSDGGSPIKARGICWSTAPNPTTASFKTINSATTTSFTDTLKPLGSQLTYYVRAYAINDFGTAYGNEISFTSVSGDAVTDIDGNVYPYITIGTQTWMTVNLKTSHYRNGDPITDGSADNGAFYKSWFTPPYPKTTGAFAYPDKNPANNSDFGKYYDNITIGDPRGICPEGWHIPTDDQWKTLEIFEGMSPEDADLTVSRGSIGSKLLVGGSSGLNFSIAGYLFLDNQAGPTYTAFGTKGSYWTSTNRFVSTQFWFRIFNDLGDPDAIYRNSIVDWACSVRCMKD